jgi:hypothetical protein
MKQKFYAIYNTDSKCLVSHKITWETPDKVNHFVPVLFSDYNEAVSYCMPEFKVIEVFIKTSTGRYLNVF